MLEQLQKELRKAGDKEQAENLARFFKTGKGEYGEGDIFLGIKVPVQRQIAKKYRLGLDQIQILLNSEIHEERLVALFILIDKYIRVDNNEKRKIFEIYLKNTENINNWDLVDLSAPRIVGDFLLHKDRNILYRLAKSESLWERRISVLATFTFIKESDFKDALKIASLLLHDKHDLIHKAVGWMLRQIGKKDLKTEEDFLKTHYKSMPRTMLRYAIEKLNEKRRQRYLRGEI